MIAANVQKSLSITVYNGGVDTMELILVLAENHATDLVEEDKNKVRELIRQIDARMSE